MKTLELRQMEVVEGGITWGCAGNAILVGASILSGSWLVTAGLVLIAKDMGCLEEW